MIGFYISAVILVFGYLNEDVFLVNLSLIIGFLLFLFNSLKSDDIKLKLNPITVFCVTKILASIGNILGYLYKDDPILFHKYWYYAIPDYLFDAALIHTLSAFAIWLGYIGGQKYIKWSLPKLSYKILPNFFIVYDFFIILFVVLIALGAIPNIMSLPSLIAQLLVFFYAYLSQIDSNYKNFYFVRAVIVLLLLTIKAFFTSYLRIEMINPSILFLFGVFMGQNSIKALIRFKFLPIYFFFFAFILSFNELGKNRTSGYAKWEIMNENIIQLFSGDEKKSPKVFGVVDNRPEKGSFLARISDFNQLSRVIMVQREDGFYYGETMAYMSYAFIPRIIWPSKPEIAVGKWFAVRAGLAHVYDNGVVNNSVDMTHGGELYLNFGYIGVILGGLLLGGFISILWTSSNFYEPLNLIGLLFGGYLLSLAYFQFGADFQIVVTLLSVYSACLLINFILSRSYS